MTLQRIEHSSVVRTGETTVRVQLSYPSDVEDKTVADALAAAVTSTLRQAHLHSPYVLMALPALNGDDDV